MDGDGNAWGERAAVLDVTCAEAVALMSEVCPLWFEEFLSSEYLRWQHDAEEHRRKRAAHPEPEHPSCPPEAWTCS